MQCLQQLQHAVRSSFRMLNTEFGRAERQTPLCYCLMRTKTRRGSRGVGRKSNGNLRIVCPEGAKELKKRGARHVSKRSHHDVPRPSRVSTSRQRVCLSSPFVLSHSNERSNQTTRAPMSSPSLGACKQNHPLKGESISLRAKRRIVPEGSYPPAIGLDVLRPLSIFEWYFSEELMKLRMKSGTKNGYRFDEFCEAYWCLSVFRER